MNLRRLVDGHLDGHLYDIRSDLGEVCRRVDGLRHRGADIEHLDDLSNLVVSAYSMVNRMLNGDFD